jgi:hypothetical protein
MKIRSANATAKIVFVILLAHTAAADASEVPPRSVIPSGSAFNAPALKSYADVQALLNAFMKKNDGPIEFSPHGAFWNEMSYKQFIEGNLPEVSDQATGKPLKILMVGNARESNIIMALRGTKGSIFDRDTGSIGRMPPTGPFMSDEEINRLADWIDRGCPDGP